MKRRLALAATAYFQVLAVAANTVFLAKADLLGVAFAAFTIQWLWTANVRRINVATFADRLTYCIAGTAGSITGMYVPSYIAFFFHLINSR